MSTDSPPATNAARQERGSRAGAPAHPDAVLILGMHRSGTSAITRVVNLLGADAPAHLLTVAEDNETGFWESVDVLNLNEEILGSAGSHWDDWRRFNPDWMRSPVAEPYKCRAIEILKREYAGSSFFVLKDPRLCRLLPFWLDVLAAFGARPRCLLPVRNPLAVAASLKRRNGFSPVKSHVLWLRHVLEAEHGTRGLPRAFLGYDRLLDDWRGVVGELSRRLDIAWPRRSARADAEIDRFLEHRHRHHAYDDSRLQEHPEVAAWVKDAYAALVALGECPDAQAPQDILDDILAQFDSASDVLGGLFGAEERAREERDARIGELESAVSAHAAHIGELESTVGEREARIGELGSLTSAHEAHVRDLEAAVGEREARIGELGSLASAHEAHVRDLEAAVGEREARIGELESTVGEREARIGELVSLTSAHEAHVRDLEAAVGEREARVGELESMTSDREGRIKELASTLSARELHIADLESAVACRDARLGGLESSLARSREELQGTGVHRHQLASRLNEVQLSASWQLARPLFRLERRWPRLVRAVAAPLKLARWGTGLRLGSRLRLQREARTILESGLFDEVWYAEQNPDVMAVDFSPALHWLTEGWTEGRDPCALFDTDWYLSRDPDLVQSGMNPLLHYLRQGGAERRDPNPLFDSQWYLTQNPDLLESAENPLVHFLRTGAADGRDPHPLFDSDWYLERNPTVAAAGVNPLADYLHGGCKTGRDPNPFFDNDWYLQQNPDVARAGMNPLVHYLLRGAEEGRNPSPSFDTKRYLAQHTDVAERGINPLVHYIEAGRAERRPPMPAAVMHAIVPPAMIEIDEGTLASTAAQLRFDTREDPCVSVIVPAFNKVEYTVACLASVHESPPETSYEILVVDDGSTDRTPALVGRIPGIRYLRNERNLGFLLSANRGARAAKGRFLMFLNNDTQVTPGWLDELVRVFESIGDAGLAGSKLIYPSGHLQEAGVALKRDGSADLVGLNDHPDKPEYNLLREVDHCSGAAFLVEKALFDDLGGFDERYAPAYYEDCDLSLKVRASGRQVIYQPRSVIVHHLSVTTAEMPSGKMAQIEKNKATFLGRWRDALEELNSVRLLAFYLPQFHPIPENDEWWGRGFTEWTNVTQARPQFEGHYQPHLPADLGFYDLRLAEVREAQAELARRYGIDGFCYYFYWFSGKRLLERPLDEVLRSGKPDFPFCICWANENWTRRWDGEDSEVLMEQGYSREDDFAFIRDVLPILGDRRYVRVKGKPLLLVYRVGLLPQPSRTASIWRDECRKHGLGEIYLAAVQSFGNTEDPRSYGFDAAVEFPPHGAENAETSPPAPLINKDFSGVCYDYQALAAGYLGRAPVAHPRFRTVMPSWDNSARRTNAPHIFVNCTPEGYEQWLSATIETTRRFGGSDERIVFVNAWNEWAEGNHLEPDRKHGHAFLRATRRALNNASGYTAGERSQPLVDVTQPPHASVGRWTDEDARKRPEATLLGHPFHPGGRGEDVRSVYRALQAVGMPARVVDIYGLQKPDADLLDELADCLAQGAGSGINIYHINGDEVEQSLAHLEAGGRLSQGAYNIIYPAWELSRYPADWAVQLDRFDEVWAPSKFIHEGIAGAVKAPVMHMPLPSEVHIQRLLDRRHFGISNGRFVFLFFFDFTSFAERKNPFAALAAFDLLLRRRPQAHVEFVVKLSGSTQRPQESAAFQRRVEGYRGKVRVLDRTLGENEMSNLVRCCDCFVSLHRSEGFGRGLSEAMYLGKPVIATGYSGNMDFTTPENALLVDYRLVPVRHGSYPHADGQVWAEADVEQAAEHMVRLVDDPQLARSIGESARSAIRKTNGYSSAGLRYQERIRVILGQEAVGRASAAVGP